MGNERLMGLEHKPLTWTGPKPEPQKRAAALKMRRRPRQRTRIQWDFRAGGRDRRVSTRFCHSRGQPSPHV